MLLKKNFDLYLCKNKDNMKNVNQISEFNNEKRVRPNLILNTDSTNIFFTFYVDFLVDISLMIK